MFGVCVCVCCGERESFFAGTRAKPRAIAVARYVSSLPLPVFLPLVRSSSSSALLFFSSSRDRDASRKRIYTYTYPYTRRYTCISAFLPPLGFFRLIMYFWKWLRLVTSTRMAARRERWGGGGGGGGKKKNTNLFLSVSNCFLIDCDFLPVRRSTLALFITPMRRSWIRARI